MSCSCVTSRLRSRPRGRVSGPTRPGQRRSNEGDGHVKRAGGRPTRWPARRAGGAVVAAVLAASTLAACSSSSGKITINFYLYPDNSGAIQQAVNTCTKQAHGAYRITYQKLPYAADGQRQQLVRRLAAHDSSLDILGL